MADDEFEKLYYSIGEVSALVDQEPHVLRYWEQEFDILDPQKNRAGRRVYTEEDISTIKRIRHLLKEEKYTIAGARQVIREGKTQRERYEEIADDLRDLRSFLVGLRDQL